MITTGVNANRHRNLAARVGTTLRYGVFGLLLLGPLAFGAVEPWSIFLMEAGAAALLLLWIGKQLLEDQVKIKWNPLLFPMGVFGVLVVLQLAFHLSAYPHDTMSLALLYAAYALLCFLASQTLLRVSQARGLAFVVSSYGAAMAGFALIQSITTNGRLYWIRQPHRGGWIYGPYVNHNHYAGLMEMLAPIPLVLALTRLTSSRNRNLAAAAAALMVGTVFLSGSRAGMLAIVTELVILAVLLVQHKRGSGSAIGLGLFLVIVVGLLVWIGGADLSRRIASAGPLRSEIATDIRTHINRDGFRMFLKKPILGWGLGTFPVVYPQFRSFYTNFFVNEAHNDFVQLLVETGLLGFATMIWFLAVVYMRGIKKIGNWSEETNGALTLACLLGLSGILVHSLFDFNLQIPANAALFYVLCTVAAAEPLAKPDRKRRTIPNPNTVDIMASPQAAPESVTRALVSG